MGGFAQGLMVAAYAVMGLGAAILFPRMFDLSIQLSVTAGIVIFFGALQAHSFMRASRREADQDIRVTEMEERTRFLRKDLERIRRDVSRVGDSGKNVSSDELVSELKLLHTLLDQVMRKQKAFEQMQAQQDEAASVVTQSPSDVEPLDLNDSIAADDTGKVDDTALPTLKDAKRYSVTSDPGGMSQDQLLTIIQGALSENRVDLYLQPIVSLPSRNVAHFECFSRVRDEAGNVIEPKDYLDLAASHGLLGTLDNLLLFRLIQLLRRLGPRRPNVRFFCNLARHSLEDEEFFPQFIDFMLANRNFSDRLVFEIAQADFDELTGPVRESLATLNSQGFDFSMDRIDNFDAIDRPLLAKEGFRFIKADHTAIGESLRPDELSILTASYNSHGLRLIASRVESEPQVIPLVDGDIEFAQGYVFGQPAQPSSFDRDL